LNEKRGKSNFKNRTKQDDSVERHLVEAETRIKYLTSGKKARRSRREAKSRN